MIAWTIGTTNPITRSFSSSFTIFNTTTLTNSALNGNISLYDTFSAFYSASGTYSETQAGATYSFQSYSEYAGETSETGSATYSYTLTVPTGTSTEQGSGESSYSTSTSGTSSGTGANNFPVSNIQTSTTQTTFVSYSGTITSTFETSTSFYTTVTSYTSFITIPEEPYYSDITVTGTKGTITLSYLPNEDFPESYTTETVKTTIDSTFQKTIDTTTYLSDTETYDWKATIYQANTRDENAEILFKMPADSSFSLLPATLGAATGTRFTITPSVVTSLISTIYSYSQLTGSNSTKFTTESFSGSTQSLNFTTAQSFNKTLTAVSTASIPHSTATYQTTGIQTVSSSDSWAILSPFTITYNFPYSLRATISTSYKTHKISYETRSVFFGDISYNRIVEKIFTTWLTGTTQAYNTSYGRSSFQSETRPNSQGGSSYTLSSSIASTEVGNTTIFENPRISTSISPDTSVNSFITKGFVIRTGTAESDTTAGGWITANGTQTFTTFQYPFYPIYALDGNNISGTTIFPRTNISYTFNNNSQTFTITSASGTSTITTTVSHVLGVSGSTLTVVDTGRSLGAFTRLLESVTNPAFNSYKYWINAFSAEFYNFGVLSLSPNQTIVNIGGEGVYKNLIDSSTAALDGNDTIYSGSSTAPISFLRPLKIQSPLMQSVSKNDIIWAEPRNSTALPFYRIPQ